MSFSCCFFDVALLLLINIHVLTDQISTAHQFVTSNVQLASERRVQHAVAAGLIVSEEATRKLIDLERSMLTSFHQCVEDNKEATQLMRAMMKKVQAGSALGI